ncbi:MAG: LamG domain-containing protein [Patescibacteria group bacterium]
MSIYKNQILSKVTIINGIIASLFIFLLASQQLLAAPMNRAVQLSDGDYLNIADEEQVGLDISGDMTIAMWVKPTTLEGNMALISKWNRADKTSYILFLEEGLVGVHLNDEPSGYDYSRLFALHGKNANEWFQVAMVYNAASTSIELFVNGVSIGMSYEVPSSISNTDADFVIGGREDRIAPFSGKIDDVIIFNRALSHSEITSLYNKPKSLLNDIAIQGFWRFNNDLLDESSNSNDLGPKFSNDVPL